VPGASLFAPNTLLGSGTLASGSTTFALNNLPTGSTTLLAQYSGDGAWTASRLTSFTVAVAPASSTTAISLSLASGQPVLKGVVTPVAPGVGTPAGAVQFVDSFTHDTVATAKLSAGAASADVPASIAGRPIFAVYSGDTNFSPSTSSALPFVVSAAGVAGSGFAPDEVVSLFGIDCLTGDTPGTLPLGTSLGSVTIKITEGAGTDHIAPLYGVFGSAGQVNFVIPGDTATGPAVVTATTACGTVTTIMNITRTAPVIFTANQTGQGAYAGQVVHVHADGSRTIDNAALLDPISKTYVPSPIEIASNDHVYLILYGTGIRHGVSVNATMNGIPVQAVFAPHAQYPGLDQINLLAPQSLAGAGQVDIVVMVDGQPANTVIATFNPR
jgi:uncharacterized protein (TIGR03437 family)